MIVLGSIAWLVLGGIEERMRARRREREAAAPKYPHLSIEAAARLEASAREEKS